MAVWGDLGSILRILYHKDFRDVRTPSQTPDPFISAKMGAANTPACRGTAYVVFEELDPSAFGNRLPQFASRCSARLWISTLEKGRPRR